MNILRKKFKTFSNHFQELFTAKQIELALIPWNFCDFLLYHSGLN